MNLLTRTHEHDQHFSGCFFSSFGQPTLPCKIVFVGINTFAPIMLPSLGLTVAVNVQQLGNSHNDATLMDDFCNLTVPCDVHNRILEFSQ